MVQKKSKLNLKMLLLQYTFKITCAIKFLLQQFFFNEPKIISAALFLFPYTCEKQESNKIISTIFAFLRSLLHRDREAFQEENIQ